MPPSPLLGVVVDRQLPLAVRAREPRPARMPDPHVHPPAGGRQLDAINLPRRDQPQQMAVQLGVAHATDPAAKRPSHPDPTHEEPGSALI